MKPAFVLSERFLILVPCLSYFSATSRRWPALISWRNPPLYALQKIEYNFVVQMSSLPSPVCLACHREGGDDKTASKWCMSQPWVRWGWLFGWQAGENSFGSRSQCFLTLHREEFESLKWLSATYLVKLLGISKFTPAAVQYQIQVFLNLWEWEE